MGLPDFHRIQQGFSEYKFYSGRNDYNTIAKHDFINENLRGEIINAFFKIECAAKVFITGEIITVEIDGNKIIERTIEEITQQTVFTGENVICAVKYELAKRLYFYVKPGLGFNSNITVSFTSQSALKFYMETNVLLGVY